MQMASIRKFREDMSNYAKKGDLVIITSHGRMAGCFFPLNRTGEFPIEFKREFVACLGREIARSLISRRITEEEILNDFHEFKKARRR